MMDMRPLFQKIDSLVRLLQNIENELELAKRELYELAAYADMFEKQLEAKQKEPKEEKKTEEKKDEDGDGDGEEELEW